MRGILLAILFLFSNAVMAADVGIPAFNLVTNEAGGQTYSVTIQILALMTMLTFLPAMIMMMTSFTRIIIVFAILRQALGLQQTPSNQVMVGLAMFLTFFIMTPVLEEVNQVAVQPYLNEELDTLSAVKAAGLPFHRFMMHQTRENDLNLFLNISKSPPVESSEQVAI